MWSFARLGSRSPRLLATAARCADALGPQFTRGQLARVVWAFAALGHHPGQGLLERAADELAADAGGEGRGSSFAGNSAVEGGSTGAAGTSNALAGAAPAAPTAAAAVAAAGLEPLSGKQAGNVLWALATLGHDPGAARLDAAAAALRPRLRACSAQSVSTVVWAYATLGHAPPRAFLDDLGAVAAGERAALVVVGGGNTREQGCSHGPP